MRNELSLWRFNSLPGWQIRDWDTISRKPLKYLFFTTSGKRGTSLTKADRVASVQLIKNKVTELHKRAFLAGDFNTSPESEEINLLSEHWINLSGTQPTFPSREPIKCIDYIWGFNCCNFTYKIIRQEVVPEKEASDHRPVFVDISFK